LIAQILQKSHFRPRNWKHDSIAYRLATRALNKIKDIEIARSRKGLAKKYKNDTSNRLQLSLQKKELFVLYPPQQHHITIKEKSE
jgi:hypothetical protein